MQREVINSHIAKVYLQDAIVRLTHPFIRTEFPFISCIIHSCLEILYSRWTPVKVETSSDTINIIIVE